MKNPARKKIRPLLSSFVDGELSPKERMLVERHVASCKESADEVADMRALSKLVRTSMEEAAEEEAWAGFPDKVMGQLLPERLPLLLRLRLWLSEVFTYQRGWVVAGSFAVALACLGMVMWTSSTEPAGYASPHLSIKTVSAKGAALKTIITHTETGDAVIWVVEETPPEEEAPPQGNRGAPSETFLELSNTPNKAGAL